MLTKVLLLLLCFYTSITTGLDCICEVETPSCDCSKKSLLQIPTKIAHSVESWNLAENKIANLKMIPESGALKKLNLSNNQITEMSYDAFDNLDFLEVLILSHNRISKIGDDIFEWNPLELKVIHLDHNNLEFVQHFLFYDLDKLIEINLSFNQISFIHPHAFGQLKNLVTLLLGHNQLHTLDNRWFNSLSPDYFDTLDFSNNKWSCDCAMESHIADIKKLNWLKDQFEKLYCFDNEQNVITSIKIMDVTVADMKAKCEFPKITGISQNTSVHTSQEIRLNCQVSHTSPQATIVWKAPNGDSYNFHNADKFDGIEAHPGGALSIKDFRENDAGKYICTATNKAGTASAETIISISKDSDIIPEDSYDPIINKKVKTTVEEAKIICHEKCNCLSGGMDCGTKNLHEIPTGIKDTFVSLNLQNNYLTTVRAGRLNLSKLLELRFDDNLIASIHDEAFINLTSLKTLSLRNNELVTLSAGVFKNLNKLDKLVLDGNKLTSITSAAFQGLASLVWLYARNNKITEIEDLAFASTNQLQFLHIEGNRLHYLSVTTIKNLVENGYNEVNTGIKRIFVFDNDFYCDCRMKKFHRYLVSGLQGSRYKYLFGDGIICQYPAKVQSQSLAMLDEDQLVCDNSTISVEYENNNSSSLMTGLWFGGMILGIAFCIGFIFAVRSRRGKSCFGRNRTNYDSLGAQDADYSSLVGSNTGGGSEAFV